jgi:hypothetical protein
MAASPRALKNFAAWRPTKTRLFLLFLAAIPAYPADPATPIEKHLFDTPIVSLRPSQTSRATFNFQSSLALSLGESEKAERDAQHWRALNGADLISKVPRHVPTTAEKTLNFLLPPGGSLFSGNPNRPPGNFTK